MIAETLKTPMAITLAAELLIPFQADFYKVCEAASDELIRQHNEIQSLERALRQAEEAGRDV